MFEVTVVDALAPANKPFAGLVSLPHTHNSMEGLGVGMVKGILLVGNKKRHNGEIFCPFSACRSDPNSGNAHMLSACLHFLPSCRGNKRALVLLGNSSFRLFNLHNSFRRLQINFHPGASGSGTVFSAVFLVVSGVFGPLSFWCAFFGAGLGTCLAAPLANLLNLGAMISKTRGEQITSHKSQGH